MSGSIGLRQTSNRLLMREARALHHAAMELCDHALALRDLQRQHIEAFEAFSRFSSCVLDASVALQPLIRQKTKTT